MITILSHKINVNFNLWKYISSYDIILFMRKLYKLVYNFITMDVKSETEAKDFAVLLRSLTLLYALNYIFSSIYLGFMSYYGLSLICCLFLGLSIGAFICTYENRTKTAAVLFYVISLITSVAFPFTVGWNAGYQYILIILLMVIFYTLEIEMKTKLRVGKIVIGIMIVVAMLTHVFPIYKQPDVTLELFQSTWSSFFYALSFLTLAYTYCTKFNLAEEKLRKTNNDLKRLASLDALTQLPNRRNITDYVNLLVFENNRQSKPFAVAIADVDFFKKVNDNYGHDTGDFVLKTLADIFARTMQGRGQVARWGGEEFLFVFDNFTGSQAVTVLNNMREMIENYDFKFRDITLKITITIGVEDFSPISGAEVSISKADEKLYQGKQNGRNQVVY